MTVAIIKNKRSQVLFRRVPKTEVRVVCGLSGSVAPSVGLGATLETYDEVQGSVLPMSPVRGSVATGQSMRARVRALMPLRATIEVCAS